jgi:hypothetical protein
MTKRFLSRPLQHEGLNSHEKLLEKFVRIVIKKIIIQGHQKTRNIGKHESYIIFYHTKIFLAAPSISCDIGSVNFSRG